MRLRRVYFVCRGCGLGSYPADERLGVEGPRTRHCERLIALAGASWSFDRAACHLRELCGLAVSDHVVREVCHLHGQRIADWQQKAPQVPAAFRQAAGDVEFTTDGTSVNTTAGWRELKVAIFSKRERGGSATIHDWERRRLPAPRGRVMFAAIQKSNRFGRRWKAWARRLGILAPSRMTVLADGARWIWEEQVKNLPGAEGVLDVFHVLEHVGRTGHVLHGEGTEQARAWIHQARQALLTGGGEALETLIDQTCRSLRGTRRQALARLETYLAPHADHLDYPRRLAEGRSIGSGQVEGACKNPFGRRLKQTGARWRPRRANRMANLCGLTHSDLWDLYWTTQAT